MTKTTSSLKLQAAIEMKTGIFIGALRETALFWISEIDIPDEPMP